MIKRRCRILLSLLLCLIFLISCGSEEKDTVLKEWNNKKTQNGNQAEVVGKNIKIGMVTDVGGIDDMGFNQSAWEGLLELQKKTGVSILCLQSETSEDYYDNFVKLCESGCDLCWGIGFECAEALIRAAKEHPDVHFAIIDNEYKNIPSNVTSVVFRAQEASFLAGYVAASVTKTKKVGYIGGVVSETLDQFEYGYKAGVDFYNFLVGTNTVVQTQYIGSFTDSEKAYDIAEEMYENGCDVIYAAAGLAGVEVIYVSISHNFYSIGVDKDQSFIDSSHVLTSVLKNVDKAIQIVTEDFIDKREIGGKTFSFGLAEGATGLPKNHHNYESYVYDNLISLSDAIISGGIVPPYNKESYEDYLYRLKTTDGDIWSVYSDE